MTKELSYIAEGLRVLAVPIEDLHIDPANARANHALDRIAASLKAYGQRKPIIANRLQSGKIEAGNGTWLAAKKLGWSHIAVVFVDDDPATAAAYGIADNRLSELSAWDLDALGALIPTVDDLFTGFTDGEIRDLLGERGGGLMVDPGPQDEKANQLAELREKWKTEPGQIWQLGKHRIWCGDSTHHLDVGRALAGIGYAALTFTSPPYWVGKDYETQKSVEEIDAFIQDVAVTMHGMTRTDESRIVINTGTGFTTSFDKRKKRQVLLLIDKMNNDNLGEKFPLFVEQFTARMFEFSLPGAPIYVVMGAQEWPVIDAWLRTSGFHWSSTIVWVKDQLVLSRKDYHTQFEPMWYGWNGDAARLQQVEDRKQSDVWLIDRPKRSEEHPTMKPLELVERSLNNSSQPGDIVLDLFAGSGTTLMACERLGRVCRTMDNDPKYVAVALERWSTATAQEPILEG